MFAVKPILKPSDLRTTSAHVNMMLMASFGLVEWLVYGLSGFFGADYDLAWDDGAHSFVALWKLKLSQ